MRFHHAKRTPPADAGAEAGIVHVFAPVRSNASSTRSARNRANGFMS